MFNGIIFNRGVITKIQKRTKGINIFVKSDLKLIKKDIGVSVSCDGVCLTLITISGRVMEFYLSDETLQRSKFKFLKVTKIYQNQQLTKNLIALKFCHKNIKIKKKLIHNQEKIQLHSI